MNISYKRLIELERPFSKNKYNGGGLTNFKVESGTIPILVSAPHAVNHYRDDAVKKADLYTGGIVRYLHELTSCHIIYSSRYSEADPNYDPQQDCDYKKKLTEYIEENDIRLVIDIHGAAADKPYAVELGTIDDEDSSLCGRKFVAKLINDVFLKEFAYIDSPLKDIKKNTIFNARNIDTITNFVSTQLGVPAIQLEINGTYRDPKGNHSYVETLIGCLTYIINTLSKIDWDASIINSYNVGFQPKRPLPNNKIEFVGKGEFDIETGDIFDLFANTKVVMGARANTDYQSEEVMSSDDDRKSDMLYLTNFLIEQLYDMPVNECKMLPIVICFSERQSFEVGVSKADSIDSVKLSAPLYEEMAKETADNYLVLYNKYTDSHLTLNPSNMDYGNKKPVPTKDDSGKKIMIPRYFRALMRFESYPLPMIRAEEYSKLLKGLSDDQKTTFTQCYEKSKFSPYYHLRSDIDKETGKTLVHIQWRELGLNETIDLITVPKKYIDGNEQTEILLSCKDDDDIEGKGKVGGLLVKEKGPNNESKGKKKKPKKEKKHNGFWNKIAKIYVGESEHPMSATWGNLIDDKNNVARMNKVAMGLLGVVGNDIILVRYKGHEQLLKVLEWENLEDYQISIPLLHRKEMEMNNINDIVMVKRYAIHAFKRKSHAQFLAVLGTLFAIFDLFNGLENLALSILVSLAVIPVALYFILIEERVRVRCR